MTPRPYPAPATSSAPAPAPAPAPHASTAGSPPAAGSDSPDTRLDTELDTELDTGLGTELDAEAPTASVWRNREFRGLTAAYVLSLAGDQFARVALTVLLYTATGSALWAATAGVAALLGPIVGGPLLGGLADSHPGGPS